MTSSLTGSLSTANESFQQPATPSTSANPPTAPGIMHTLRSSLSILSLRSIVSTASSLVSTTTRSISSTATSALGASPCSSEYPPDVDFSDSCAACLDPCTDHPQLPARLAAKVNQGAMAGSVKPYSHHLILCTGSSPASWAARVDSASPLARALSQVAGELPAVAPAKVSRVLANVCDRAPLGGVQHFFDKDGNEVECMDVMVWPDRVLLTGVTADNVGAAVKEYFEHEKVESVEPSDMAQGLPRPAMEPLDVDRAVFVCAHKKRDSRCGEAAPLLLRAFHDEIDALEAKSVLAHGSTGIYGISHIGGHKFAGTMV
ncbi:Sucrase/ferredoxin-like-domain-containing protein [Catenaria anguillulae PL171]|uniref:Sucrase/ferredoxin-like-domain-containing protein n=1 Tax=Catenaria anguillulae PL171 TaxID=765915 RepID=A0A1Y2HE17_9FUNG|nr:Sucrase/ferredoxin-like-domain-containing protein [Catenaria anguillulae PL171]